MTKYEILQEKIISSRRAGEEATRLFIRTFRDPFARYLGCGQNDVKFEFHGFQASPGKLESFVDLKLMVYTEPANDKGVPVLLPGISYCFSGPIATPDLSVVMDGKAFRLYPDSEVAVLFEMLAQAAESQFY